MSCDRCQDLCVEYRITLPSDLRRAIKIIGDSVNDGTLQEVQLAPKPYCSVPFQDLVTGGAWDDIVSYDFQCYRCGQEFNLGAETYHGRGGSWRAVRSNA